MSVIIEFLGFSFIESKACAQSQNRFLKRKRCWNNESKRHVTAGTYTYTFICTYTYMHILYFLCICRYVHYFTDKNNLWIKTWATNSMPQGLARDTDEFCAQGPQWAGQLGSYLVAPAENSHRRTGPSAVRFSDFSKKPETQNLCKITYFIKIDN